MMRREETDLDVSKPHFPLFAFAFLLIAPVIIYSAFKKVLNRGLGPHEDQTVEMVLI